MHFWKEARGLAKNVKRVTCEKEAFIFSDKLMNHKRDSHAVFAVMHALFLVLWGNTINDVTSVTTILFTTKLLRFIMLVLHVHLHMFFRKSFKAAYDTRKHGDCRLVLLAMMLCVSNVIIFPYQKENCMGIKWYV